jgi:hypothetical protein
MDLLKTAMDLLMTASIAIGRANVPDARPVPEAGLASGLRSGLRQQLRRLRRRVMFYLSVLSDPKGGRRTDSRGGVGARL